MYYKYHCGNEILRVFSYAASNPFNKTVVVEVGPRDYTRSIREDEKGEFFTWNKQKIYVNDWIRMTMAELRDNLHNDDYWMVSDDLCIAIATDGPENVRLAVPNKLLYLDGDDVSICHIEEEFNRKVLQNYKLNLVFEDEYGDRRVRDFYTSDLFSMIRSGLITIEDSVKNT